MNETINTNVSCPVGGNKMDENKIRISAAMVFLLAIGYTMFPSVWIYVFMAYDFYARLFLGWKFSLTSALAKQVVKVFNISQKPVDEAPKRFAAKLGLFVSFAVLISHFSGYHTFASWLNIVLLICAMLESVFRYCVGCKVYLYLHQPAMQKIFSFFASGKEAGN